MSSQLQPYQTEDAFKCFEKSLNEAHAERQRLLRVIAAQDKRIKELESKVQES